MSSSGFRYSNVADALRKMVTSTSSEDEERGQSWLCQAPNKLPNPTDKDRFEMTAIGFVIGDPIDDMFVACTFPEGWTINPTEGTYWSTICDPQGRRRFDVFYKAAVYDKAAVLTPICRYTVTTDKDEANPEVIHIVIRDADAVRYEVGVRAFSDFQSDAELRRQAHEWLEQNYPHYRNPYSYWTQ